MVATALLLLLIRLNLRRNILLCVRLACCWVMLGMVRVVRLLKLRGRNCIWRRRLTKLKKLIWMRLIRLIKLLIKVRLMMVKAARLILVICRLRRF